MPEEIKNVKQETKEETPKSLSILEEAGRQADRLEAANRRTEELLKRQEELIAKQMLGGRSSIGTNEQPKIETPKEYKDRIMREGLK